MDPTSVRTWTRVNKLCEIIFATVHMCRGKRHYVAKHPLCSHRTLRPRSHKFNKGRHQSVIGVHCQARACSHKYVSMSLPLVFGLETLERRERKLRIGNIVKHASILCTFPDCLS